MSLFFRHKVEPKNFVQQLQVVAARQGVEVLCELLSAGSEARFGTFAAGSRCPPQTKGLRISDLLEYDLKSFRWPMFRHWLVGFHRSTVGLLLLSLLLLVGWLVGWLC